MEITFDTNEDLVPMEAKFIIDSILMNQQLQKEQALAAGWSNIPKRGRKRVVKNVKGDT